MGTKRKPAKKRDPNPITATDEPGEDEAVAVARTMLQPTVQAAVTLKEYTKSLGDLDLFGLIDALTEQTRAIREGDLKRAGSMLAAQAHTLDHIFNTLARRAIHAEFTDQFDCFLKHALRAQAQCRATWEALATIKNPPLAGYIRQANLAAGPQQVNNGCPVTEEASRARDNPNRPNKLMEATDGERLDTGAAGTAGRIDPDMATVGKLNGSTDRGW